jgi:hypothetical protein
MSACGDDVRASSKAIRVQIARQTRSLSGGSFSEPVSSIVQRCLAFLGSADRAGATLIGQAP